MNFHIYKGLKNVKFKNYTKNKSKSLNTGSTQKLREKFDREIVLSLSASNREKSLSSDGIYPLGYI
ncbi:hypothetical protein KUTeg_014509 [Tegillarca granosa]|uniref:Uncharacterized protein n=1 Tax=Tegillarca granosa TaxID=220873 RepID=A0ABQ9ERZ9_TEGGR|nr:hypothetical protein KUTeg_014509 [Tegillarca granosa]